MIVQMASDYPRFNPVPFGDFDDRAAAVFGETRSHDSGDRGEPDGNTGLGSRATHAAYRLRVLILSGSAFLTGSVLSIVTVLRR